MPETNAALDHEALKHLEHLCEIREHVRLTGRLTGEQKRHLKEAIAWGRTRPGLEDEIHELEQQYIKLVGMKPPAPKPEKPRYVSPLPAWLILIGLSFVIVGELMVEPEGLNFWKPTLGLAALFVAFIGAIAILDRKTS